MTIAKDVLLCAALVGCAILWWRMAILADKNELLTIELQQAEFERDASKAQAEIFWGEIVAQTDAAAACLAREAQTAQDAAERKDILEKARSRPRTKKEQDEVVDDETRGRAVERLNRPL
ncbi:MAG TPA: hypothetical protein H9894_10170 [Candidatus Desulfovibrio intestinipullorum]|uniref:Uncharacterized protein n=1 Tax=Candidatus Desulfovibrio intestinipullorum TaxID=2838536 RepID=A0A9D1PZQ0_9BACT|nr:hypothetical protein [Candidatus Desulfovibrio intestinipullorum]